MPFSSKIRAALIKDMSKEFEQCARFVVDHVSKPLLTIHDDIVILCCVGNGLVLSLFFRKLLRNNPLFDKQFRYWPFE